jgi:hypothetical protein
MNAVLGQNVEDRDLERSVDELITYNNLEADTAEKSYADCVTGVNCRILADVKSAREVCAMCVSAVIRKKLRNKTSWTEWKPV